MNTIVEAFPYIRPGIINFGIGGQSIARWINVDSNDQLYNVYYNSATNPNFSIDSDYSDISVGSIFRIHTNIINIALEEQAKGIFKDIERYKRLDIEFLIRKLKEKYEVRGK